MAFLSKFGGILRQTVSKQVDSQLSPASPSIFQAIRWMSSSKVFIGGVSYSTDDTSLREAFAQYGDVVDARVIVDRETGRSRGFAFVTFTSSEEASSAIQALDGQELHGRRVRVAYATDRARGVGGGGYSGGQGGYGGGQGGYGGGQGGYGGGQGGYGGAPGGYGGSYGSGGYGGSGAGGQGGVDGYGTGGANYGGGYGGGSFGTGGSPGGYNAGGYGAGGGASDTSFGDGANFGVSGGAGGSVTGDTGFGKSGFEEGSGLGYGGGSSDQFGAGATSGFEDKAADFELNEPVDRADRDEDETDDFAKRA